MALAASQGGSARRRRQRGGAPQITQQFNAETADNISVMTSLTTTIPSAEEMRVILQQSLKEHGSSWSDDCSQGGRSPLQAVL